MYDAKVLEVVIASPSDVEVERDICESVLHEQNTIRSKSDNIILQPRRWESSVHSEVGKSPQDSINTQIIKDADILIAIFWSRIGSPTGQYESGTVEEIKEHASKGKPALLFFSKKAIEQEKIDTEQLNGLNSFKDWCKSNSIFIEYVSDEDFRHKLHRNIELLIVKRKDELTGKSGRLTPTEKQEALPKQDVPEFSYKFPSLHGFFITEHCLDDFLVSLTQEDWVNETCISEDGDTIWKYQYCSRKDRRISYIISYDENNRSFYKEWLNFISRPDPAVWKGQVEFFFEQTSVFKKCIVSLDGGRFVVPLPKVEYHDGFPKGESLGKKERVGLGGDVFETVYPLDHHPVKKVIWTELDLKIASFLGTHSPEEYLDILQKHGVLEVVED
jgi:hypothetical protein